MFKMKYLWVWVIIGFWVLVGCVLLIALHNDSLVGVQIKKRTESSYQMTASPSDLYIAIEKERQQYNLPPLSHNPDLDASAQDKCTDMVNNHYYGHDNPTTGQHGGSYIFSHVPSATFGDEILNIGDNPKVTYSAPIFMESWMKSPDHKSAIIDPKFTDVGFAVCTVDGRTVAVGHMAVIPH